ncbi:MAG: chromosome segregation ATPase [Marinoscillum sp.]|jgi:chromosome segregation ATPase
MANSAYVISGVRAELLNDKLAELKRAYAANAELVTVNAVLQDKVMEIERLVVQLMQHMREDQELVSLNNSNLLSDLDQHIRTLQVTNTKLDQQNAEFQKQLNAMEQTIKSRKRAIRKIWWRNALEKFLFGLAGFGIGWLVSR